ncbi:MAG: hypothetical protein AAFY65_07925 [Pseudomonadota bacterium]
MTLLAARPGRGTLIFAQALARGIGVAWPRIDRVGSARTHAVGGLMDLKDGRSTSARALARAIWP